MQTLTNPGRYWVEAFVRGAWRPARKVLPLEDKHQTRESAEEARRLAIRKHPGRIMRRKIELRVREEIPAEFGDVEA